MLSDTIDGGEAEQNWIEAMKKAEGEICLKWPAGQLLCPHYAIWDSDIDGFRVYIPRDGGEILTTKDEALIGRAAKSQYAKLINKREAPFDEHGGNI